MTRKEIMATLKGLACSQGFYGRIVQSIEEMDDEKRDALMTMLEKQNFKNPLDLVMFFEC